MSQQIYTKRKIAYKKQNIEDNCVLQESCKTVRRLQRSYLLVKGGHSVGYWNYLFTCEPTSPADQCTYKDRTWITNSGFCGNSLRIH